MAARRYSSQHAKAIVKCENCEKNPSQYICKTCPGHLCKECKIDHESRKITKNHEITHVNKNMEGALCLLFCRRHAVKKLELYCSLCKEPICTKCHIESHNGHKMEELATVYNEIRCELENKKEYIEGELMPRYRELLSDENIKKSEISKRTDEVRKQIEDHKKSIIEQVTMIEENTLQILRNEEKLAIESVEKTENEIKRRIETLKNIKEDISNTLVANPDVTFFKAASTASCKKFKYSQ
ncbi:E3 ubiquitin-protein ligase TRIM36-like [Saccostrea cucullata]|uniref:E3 ubiquitin-protein ligase TRIM36-like n=1 Tax=Saccostrea cuccullata TaxID=36930 RepID=UPI002ED6AEFC